MSEIFNGGNPEFQNLIVARTNEQGSAEDQQPKKRANPWMSFTENPDPAYRFSVQYGGPYAQRLEINMDYAERVLYIMGIDRDVTLTDMSRNYVANRNVPPPNLNPDGSQAVNTFSPQDLFRLRQNTVEESKFYNTVVSPDTFRIEMSGSQILDSLLEKDRKKPSKKPLDERFLKEFREEFISAMTSLTSQDHFFRLVTNIVTNYVPVSTLLTALQDGRIDLNDITGVLYGIGGYVSFNSMAWAMGVLTDNPDRPGRAIHGVRDVLLPPNEFDRKVRATAFMRIKGRNMIRFKDK